MAGILRHAVLILMLLLILILRGYTQLEIGDSLSIAFKNPPEAAKPRVWWHWMNGNVTREGITADLEWMKRVGIAGAQVFDVDLHTPQVVPAPLNFMSDGWRQAFFHAGQEADRLGLELGMASSGGWSESGGPWVKPEEAMKRIVWSDTIVQGNRLFSATLPMPGNLYHFRVTAAVNEGDSVFYRDSRLLAFRIPEEDNVAQVSDLAEKAQYRVSRPDGQRDPTPAAARDRTIDPSQVIDLSRQLQRDGQLNWSVPVGRWKLMRMGYTLTGQRDRFGTVTSQGFEVDKLNARHTRQYLDDWLGRIQAALGPAFALSLQYLVMDSWEVGVENWTEDLVDQFRLRRHYDPTPYLPVLAGYVVGSADESDRFLWDFRHTLADLVADEHYGVMSEYVLSRGLKGIYAEAIGVEQPTTGDGLQAKGRVEIPMGEFVLEPWRLPGGRETNRADLKEAASAAHIYGKPFAAAEAFTTTEADPWAQSPYDLKPYADWAFSLGINRMVIHTSAHQPFTDDAHKPGITLSNAGQNYTRNNTWGEQSIAFNSYLSRCSYLLQQGMFVADVLYYYGDDAPVVVPYWKAVEPALPAGYDNDWINTEMLLKASVEDGKIVLPDGMSYRLLVIPNDVTRLTPMMIRKLRELVAGGALLLAPHPGLSPSLEGYPQADDSIRLLSEELWGPYGGIRRYHEEIGHRYGKGIVYSQQPVQEVLNELHLAPDFRCSQPDPDDTIVWTHRRIINTEIYFVANQQARPVDIVAQFRVTGKEAEFWHPDTGEIEPAAYDIGPAVTTVPLHLDPRGSIFVVFRKAAKRQERTMPIRSLRLLMTLDDAWLLSFPSGWGVPTHVNFNSLISWTQSTDSGIRYFSGTAVYRHDFKLPSSCFVPGKSIVLDLGMVKEIAEVSVNGQPLGICWKPPFRVDITHVVRPGMNRMEVGITNLWPNRLIGDEQPGAKRYTFSLIRPFTKDSPLLESGLLGPVKVYLYNN